MLFEMLYGKNPFNLEEDDLDNQVYYEKVAKSEVKFPEDKKYSDNIVDLIKKLLDKDPKKRIDMNNIKNHPWFKDVKW